jgi:predicted amidohydrolase
MSALPVVTLHQWQPARDPRDNLEEIRGVVQGALAAGSNLVVFPEYSSSFAPGGPSADSQGESLKGEWVAAVRLLSHETGVTIVVGCLRAEPGEVKLRNTMLALSQGEVVARADKLHLYDAFGGRESEAVLAGKIDSPQLFSWEGLRIGMMACYDLRFPEVTRRLVDAGATAIIVPAQWASGEHKAAHWDALLQARAIEGQVFVIAVDQPAPHSVGFSQVIDPWGRSILRLGEGTETSRVGVDRRVIDEVRLANPMAQARRFRVIQDD